MSTWHALHANEEESDDEDSDSDDEDKVKKKDKGETALVAHGRQKKED
jgi:hypothetical protein